MVQHSIVAVVVDSSCCLPTDLLKQYNITLVPHELVIDGVAYRDVLDIDATRFYQLVQNGRRPTTSAPKPPQFLEAFYEASKRARSVLALTLSANFSSAFNSARLAQQMAAESLPEFRIEVVDTQAAAGAEGLIALEAAKMAAAGQGIDAVKARVEELIPKVNLLAFLDTLTFLARSGRIPRVAAWAGSLLDIKPLTELKLGEARLLEKPRSRARAMQRLLEIVRERVQQRPTYLLVMHANCLAGAQKLTEDLKASTNCVEMFLGEFTPVMGAHTGPGLLGVAFYTR